MSKITSLLGNEYQSKRKELSIREFDLHGFKFKVKIPLVFESDLIYKKITNQPEEKINEMFLQLTEPLNKFKDIEDSSISFNDGDVKVEGRSLKEAAKLQLMTQTRITEYIKLLVPADENGSMQDITYDDISAEWPLSVQLALVEKIGEVISPTYKESRGN